MTSETQIVLALVLPAAAALLIPLFHGQPNRREAVTIVAALALFVNVGFLVPAVLAGARPAIDLIQVLPGLSIAFAIEPLGMLFAAVASTLWIVNSIYSIGYMRGNNEPRQTGFYVCFAVAIAATMGIAFAGNLFTLFIFYEALTLSTYPLVTHKADEESVRAGRLYLLMLIGASILLLLPAIAWTGVIAGTLDFRPGGILGGRLEGPLLGVLLFMFIFGIGKAAVMPMHRWLPAAMVAPTPVSALLHAVAVVKAGVFTVVKVIVYVFGIDTLAGTGAGELLVYVAGFTVVMASTIALLQDNLKRRLAFSTVSQLSYVVLGAALLTPISVAGAAIHLAAHAVSKITLFFAAGSVYTAAHVTEISRMTGIGRRMPWTMGAFTVASLSMIGLPLSVGFLGKWMILEGAMSTGQWVAVGVLVLSTILNAGYFLPIVVRAFARPPASAGAAAASAHGDHGEAPWPIVLALTVTAIGTVMLFFFPGGLLAFGELLVAEP